jgi:hypothetical protein
VPAGHVAVVPGVAVAPPVEAPEYVDAPPDEVEELDAPPPVLDACAEPPLPIVFPASLADAPLAPEAPVPVVAPGGVEPTPAEPYEVPEPVEP